MGEISFRYNVNTEPLYEIGFKYWFSESIEYSFAYQRYVAFSDASIFNSPVAITKVATGLYQYYDLFLDKNSHAATYNIIKNFDMTLHDIQENKHDFADNPYGNISRFNDSIEASNSYLPNVNISKDNASYRQDLIGDNYDFVSLRIDDKSFIVGFKENWLSRDFLLSIYSNFIARDLHRNSLNMYSEIYNISRAILTAIKDDEILSTLFDSKLSIYEIYLANPSSVGVNILNNITSGKISNKSYVILKNTLINKLNVKLNIPLDVHGRMPDNKLNNIKTVLANSFLNEMSIFDVIFGKRKDLINNAIAQLLSIKQPEKYNSYVYETLNASPIVKSMVANKSILGKVNSKYITMNNFIQGYTYGRICNCFENITSTRADTNIVPNLFSEIRGAVRNQLDSFFDKQYSAYLYIKPVYNLNVDTFTISEERYCITIGGLTTIVNPNYLQSEKVYQCFKGNKQILENKQNTYASANIKSTLLSESVFGNKNNHILQYGIKSYFVLKKGSVFSYTNKPAIAINKSNEVHSFYSKCFLAKNSSDLDYFSNTLVGKFSKDIKLYNEQAQVYKDRISMTIYKSIASMYRARIGIFYDNDSFVFKDTLSTDMELLNVTSVFKDKKDIVLENNIFPALKDKHSIYLFANLWVAKENYKVYSFPDDAWIFRDNDNINHEMSLYDQYFASKKNHYASIYQQMQTFIKSKIIASAPDFNTVIKNHLPTDYVNTLHNNHAGMIIPISKVKHQGYIDGIDLSVSKLSKNGYLNQNIFSSVMPKDTRTELTGLFCDKKEFNTYINYRNIQITKAKIHAFINSKSIFIYKIPYSSNYKDIDTSIWSDKNIVNIWTSKQLGIQKQSVDVHLEDTMYEINKKEKYAYSHDSLFVDKNNQMCYYDYGMTWADSKLRTVIDFQLNTVTRAQDEAHMLDCVSSLIKNELNAFYDYGIFGNRDIHKSDLFNHIHEVHKKVCDTGIKPEDFGNWAWVYETPDPFDGPSFTIDELLLPENDTRYENFEDIIFDKKNMRPRNPVKVIDDNTFIAKYPIKHPLPEYSNVALEYDKGAIRLENFYGIETSIMHTVFLKFYRIWQSKIFEFGTMTMTQSVKLMLEYMYSWIMEYFPVDEIEQALRVFKLIRWYGETSIIQNSQYIISYEYGILESKLNTGTCLIPNNLDDNDTMYVDARLGVIRNNPAYINTDTGAYVIFEIDNKKNTTFTFSLSNTVGSVNIYINDTLVDTVSRSALNLTYELPYTGDTNIVKIEKEASHNLNGNFYIGNIKIPNATFKELSIEFDPTLKAGNKPLNEIARKMIYFANLHEDREEAYEIIRKGNLGVGEIYKHLMEYWELHHKGKNKGKRLTIKEV